LKDFDYKSLTKTELEDIFREELFEVPPMWHQLVSLAFAGERDRVAFFHSAGTGKTLTSLYTYRMWGCPKTMVVCPSSAFGSWERDFKKLGLSYVFVTGTPKQRTKALAAEVDFYVINYEGLKSVYAVLPKKRRGQEGKRSWHIDRFSFVHDFNCIVFDEVHKCKNYLSIQSNICDELARRAKHVIGLTGTPIDKSMLELFNIFKVIDRGKSLGNDFYAYRDEYFRPVEEGFGYDLADEFAEEDIFYEIEHTTLSFSREECFELPDLHEIIRPIQPDAAFTKLQRAIIEGTKITADGETLFIQRDQGIIAHKLRQITAGFFYHTPNKLDPDDPREPDPVKQTHYLKKNPKVAALVDILDNDPSKKIVFYRNIGERFGIEKGLKNAHVKFESVNGTQKNKQDRLDAIERFRFDPDIQVLVCQMTCANEGFDAFEADTVIFMSPVTSPKMRNQCIARVYRKGQLHKCLVIELCMEKSVDTRLLQDREGRFSFVQSAMQYISDFHKEKRGIR